MLLKRQGFKVAVMLAAFLILAMALFRVQGHMQSRAIVENLRQLPLGTDALMAKGIIGKRVHHVFNLEDRFHIWYLNCPVGTTDPPILIFDSSETLVYAEYGERFKVGKYPRLFADSSDQEGDSFQRNKIKNLLGVDSLFGGHR